MEKALPKYEELDGKLRERQAAGAAVLRTQERLAKDREARQRESAALAEMEAEQRTYAGLDAQTVRLEHAYAQARENTEALAGIRSRADKLTRDRGRLKKEEDLLGELAASAAEAERCHHRLYQAFIGGQAGLLAEGLRRDLAEHRRAVCPVCRTEFRGEQTRGFAPLPAETPAQADVDAARQDYDRQEEDRRKREQRVAKLRASVDVEAESVLRDAAVLLPACTSREVLSGEGWLSGNLEEFQRIEAEGRRALEGSRKKQVRSGELAQRQKQAAERMAELDQALSRGEEALTELRLSVGTLEAAISALGEYLQYPDKETADARLRQRRARRDCLRTQVRDHLEALQAAASRRDTVRGKLAGKRDDLPELERSRAEAEAALEAALKECGFAAPEDAAQALLPLGGQPGEDWLAERQSILTQYRHALADTRGRIQELAARTEGLAFTNLAALQEEIGRAAEASRGLNAEWLKLTRLIENHQTVAERVSRSKAALKRTEATWNRLDLLANLAVGVSGDGGKLSFDRYVMGAVFQEVLEMANRRLNIMSGGKYELIHQISADRKNAKAGLEVEVLDMATGKQRNSRSLSGGESFLVSLSLALGLSDVVQSHTGGRRLDALFIDEGFGSLDGNTLDTALHVLNQLTEGNCLVGIISHVSRLEESVPQKIRVKNSQRGSTLRFE